MAQKTIKVPPVVHALLMERARKQNVTAGAVLVEMLDRNSVTVALQPVQHERWEAAAAECGVALPQFILLVVESLLGAGRNPATSEPPAVPKVWGACCASPAGVTP